MSRVLTPCQKIEQSLLKKNTASPSGTNSPMR